MRITFDSNVWEFVVKPSRMSNNSNHGDFCAIHEALRTKRIEGFISKWSEPWKQSSAQKGIRISIRLNP